MITANKNPGVFLTNPEIGKSIGVIVIGFSNPVNFNYRIL